MIFQWLEGVWQTNSTYKGKQFIIKIVKPRTSSRRFIANILVDGKQTSLPIHPDSDINNVGMDASIAVQQYIDANP